MNIAFILFNDITLLDLIGVYDPICRLRSMKFLPDLKWDLCALQSTVTDSFGLTIQITKLAPDLADYDVIIVPGGYGTRTLVSDDKFLNWLRTAAPVPLKASVCTGSLLLGAAGFLRDKKATTNFLEYKNLAPYCETVSTERLVEDNGIITAGAVSTSLDLGLYLCNKWVGQKAMDQISERMHYNLHPEVATLINPV